MIDPDDVAAAHLRRLRTLDPDLPVLTGLRPTEDTTLLRAGCGASGAIGLARRTLLEPDSTGASWSALDEHRLTPRVAGPDPAGALDALLDVWRDHIRAAPPGPYPDDTAAGITWPSRDTAAVPALVRHGLSPLVAIVTRPAGRPIDPGPVAPDLTVRPSTPDDLDEIAALRLETQEYDAQFGVVSVRPATARVLRELTEEKADRGWTWVAQRSGRTVGMITLDPPEHAGWAQAMTRRTPIAYVDCLGVHAADRGTGAGSLLLATAHHAVDAAGIAATLLHHAVPNPLSAPLYHRHGYRPLWTQWELRPASALR
jgi:ribosomal protein S18 acetylase RimI-like enzyme